METAACILDCRNQLGEGIVWDPRDQVLYWVDIPLPSRLHRLDPVSGQHDSWEMPAMTSALAVREAGGLLLVSEQGLSLFDPDSGALELVARLEAHLPGNRSNDGCTDRQGRFWFGTMQNNYREDGSEIEVGPRGHLYRVDSDLSVHLIRSQIRIPNSTAFSPAGERMYFCDTPTREIEVFAIEPRTGLPAGPPRLFNSTHEYGYPDGSTVDSEGYLWNARWGAGCVIRFSPEGTIDRIFKIPASQVTCCTFGGPELDTLYVTTARIGLAPEALGVQPQAGGLFALRPGPRGLPPTRFQG